MSQQLSIFQQDDQLIRLMLNPDLPRSRYYPTCKDCQFYQPQTQHVGHCSTRNGPSMHNEASCYRYQPR